ncbi:hypothetical protein CSPX01_06153, partial [Colletotrichum filicis]
VPIWLRQRTSPSVIIPFFLLFGHPLRHLDSPPVVVPAYLLSRPINKSASHHQLGSAVLRPAQPFAFLAGGTQFVLSASLRLQLQAVLFPGLHRCLVCHLPAVAVCLAINTALCSVLDFRRSPIPPPQRGCRVFWALFAYRMPAVPRTSFEISKKIVLCHKHLYQ